MKYIYLIIGTLLVSLTISVSGQDYFINTSLDKGYNEQEEMDSTELYDSLYDDFDNLYRLSTIKEEIEESNMDSLYNDILNSFNILKLIEDDSKNDTIYSSIYEDFKNI